MRNDPQPSLFHTWFMAKKQAEKVVWYAKEWLAHKGLKQSHIVSRTTFNKGQVSDYLTKRRRWNEDVLAAFADAIGVDPADLLRPPASIDNELAKFIMAMDQSAKRKVLKVIRALEDEEKSA